MKQTKIFAGTALMMLFVILNAACAMASTSKINGHLDSIEGNAVSGWLWNSEAPDEAQEVTVTVTNIRTGEVAATNTAAADEYREDLAEDGIGSGNYGFHVEIDWDSLPEACYTVSLSSGQTSIARSLQYTNGDCEDCASGNLVSLGNFRLTSYCPCYQCSEGWGRRTSSGALASANHTVAVDPKVIPIGSRLMINGVEYVAEDVGGAVKGNHIDIYYNTHAETIQNGTRNAEVYLVV